MYCIVERRKAYSQDEARRVGVGWEAPTGPATTQALSQFSPVTCFKENHWTTSVRRRTFVIPGFRKWKARGPRSRPSSATCLQVGYRRDLLQRTKTKPQSSGSLEFDRRKESQGAERFGRPLLYGVEVVAWSIRVAVNSRVQNGQF